MDADDRFLERLRSGEEAAGREFVREHYGPVYRYLRSLTGQPDLAEDLAQETFLQAWRHLESFKGQGSLRNWLYRIARREFLDLLQRRRAETGWGEIEGASAPDAAAWMESVELRGVIDRLPLEEREVLLLHHLEGYSSGEIAAIVGAPDRTIRRRLARARERLRQELGEDDLGYVNESLAPMRHWMWLPLDRMRALEARLFGSGGWKEEGMERREFIQQAAVGVAGLALTEPGKEVVDGRLMQKVTLAFKGTALVDLCERLRQETNVPLSAGASVADEKVTLFCRLTPLRDVMRQLSRPFGYTWTRSGSPGAYRYELLQDLRSQLLEEELRNHDRDAALLSLEQELERFRPYLSLTPDEILERARTASPAEKKLLEKIGGSETQSALGWGPIQMYFRLTSQEKLALVTGETLYFSEGPRPGERPLPPEVARGILQGWRDLRAVKAGDGYRFAGANEPGSIPISQVPEVRASVNVSLDRSELGQFGLNGLTGFYGPDPMNRRTTSGPYATGRSPRVVQPENSRVNARFAKDPALKAVISLLPQHVCSGARREPASTTEPHVTTADLLEALHRASGRPIVADYYTRLYPPDRVSVRGQTLFAALNQTCDTMRLRWNVDGEWLQFRSTSYYDDRIKEVPNRLLERWATVRRQQGGLRLDDLIEIAGLSDAQLAGAEMAEGAKACFGLPEWDLARHVHLQPSLRFLAEFTPDQRRRAERPEGLPFTAMSLAQQQGFIARRWPPKRLGTNTPNTAPPPSPEDLAGAVLRVDYRPAGWYEWRPPGPYLLQWLVPVDPGPNLRLVPRPIVRERTREAALQALRRVDPQIRAAVLAAAGRSDPRPPAEPASDEAQIVPTELNLTLIYLPAKQSSLVVSRDFWSVLGAW